MHPMDPQQPPQHCPFGILKQDGAGRESASHTLESTPDTLLLNEGLHSVNLSAAPG